MTELEPTRTYSNHPATEILRRLLDERGVEWEDCGNGATYVEHNGEAWRFDYDEPFDQLCIVCLSGYTPEQAIAATVGSDKVEAVLRKLIAQLGIAADFHFARKYVDCIVEEYAGKLATLGTGTCKRVFYEPTGVYVCSECGRGLSKKLDKYCYLHYCPNCGRRIEQ